MAQIPLRQISEPPLLRIEPFKGMNLSVTPTQIDQSQSPDMLNMNIDERGALNKRTGYERVFADSLGAGAINGLYEYRKKDGTVLFLLAHGTKLYTQSGNEQPVEIYEGLADQQINFFTMNDKCYIMDGVNFLVYDGKEAKEIEPYIPIISISKPPGGGGEVNEDFNLLGSGFKDWFSANGTAKDFILSLRGLDDTPVKAVVNGEDKVEGTDLTVDRIAGKVTFTVAPTQGTNNVVITAHKTFGVEMKDYFNGDTKKKEFQLSRKELDDDPITASINGGTAFDKVEGTDFTVDREKGKVTFITAPPTGTNNVVIKSYKKIGDLKQRIKKCRFHVLYGGANDTRVFVSGNEEMSDHVWRSGLYDPTYFPENGFYKFPEKVKGFSRQYDYLVIHRENGLHQVTYGIDATGFPSFPSKPINDQVGTLTNQSIQIVENNPAFLSKDGVYMLVASSVRDERNVQHLSENIDAKLLNEPNLENAISVEYDKKYWLAVNGNVYLFDYAIKEWFLYDNIKANCFIERNGELLFGSYSDGLIYRFMKESEPTPFNDDGIAINAYWKSKYFTFGADELRKFVEKVFFSLKPMTRTSADLYYVTNKKESNLVKTSRMDLFDYRNIDYNNWSYILSSFPQESMAKIKAKKITHFQLIIKNDKLDEGLGLLSVGIKHKYQSYIK